MSAVGLIIILGLGLALYGTATYQDHDVIANIFYKLKLAGKFTGGFFIGALGGALVAYLLLLQI